MADLTKIESELAPERSKVSAWVTWLQTTFQIVDDSTLNQAGDLVKAAKARWGVLEAKRKELTGPLLDVKNNIDAMFKSAQDPLAEAERILKTKLGEYAAAKQREKAEAMQLAAATFQAGGTPCNIIPEPVAVQGITTRQVWTFRITDPAQVPREWCSPDPDIIRRVLVTGPEQAPAQIPGVEFYLENRVAVRGKP